uniref:Ovule protein n=1 Tax=Strongyloides papillosus TaxID=174720 RepID=A0A0N5CAQ7_STREA
WSTSKNMTDRCPYIKNYTDTVFGPYVRNLSKNFLISSQTTTSPTTPSQTTQSLCQTGSLVANEFSLDDCRKMLTKENIIKWCKTSFFGPNCLKLKLKSSGLLPKSLSDYISFFVELLSSLFGKKNRI